MKISGLVIDVVDSLKVGFLNPCEFWLYRLRRQWRRSDSNSSKTFSRVHGPPCTISPWRITFIVLDLERPFIIFDRLIGAPSISIEKILNSNGAEKFFAVGDPWRNGWGRSFGPFRPGMSIILDAKPVSQKTGNFFHFDGKLASQSSECSSDREYFAS